MWQRGIVLQCGKQTAEVTVVFSGDLQSILVCCVSRDSSERFLIRRIAEECEALFEAVFPARNGQERPVKQFVACRHCLAKSSTSNSLNSLNSLNSNSNVSWLPLERCVEMILQNVSEFQCGGVAVPTSVIGDDLTFGYVSIIAQVRANLSFFFFFFSCLFAGGGCAG
jgi:hypothetical protein